MTADTDKVCEKLNDLIELDHDAISAYAAAIERLETEEFRRQLTTYKGDHERHTQNLGGVVTQLGGTPKQHTDAMEILTKGKVVIAGLVGDKAILGAMKANEEVTNKTYSHVLKAIEGHPEAETVVAANLEDERRHKEWIDRTLDRL